MTLQARCPAAELLAGPPTSGPSVVCRVLTRDAEAVDSILEGMPDPLVTMRDEPTTLRGFCCGRGLPRVTEDSPARAHHSFCPIWEASEEAERRRTEAEERVFDAPEPPKILGIDKEVEAELLGIDVEQVPDRSAFAPETTTGVEAMQEIADDDEWKESK